MKTTKLEKDFLIQTVREYVARVKRNDRITLDTLLLSIDKDMKDHKRYAKKIDFSHLRRFMSGCEEEILVQQRVYEFLITRPNSIHKALKFYPKFNQIFL